MLVLTRRPQQSIMIGDEIVVTVLEVKGDQIRIGITAPRHVQVYREEVLVALAAANQAAVLTEGTVAPPVPQAGGLAPDRTVSRQGRAPRPAAAPPVVAAPRRRRVA